MLFRKVTADKFSEYDTETVNLFKKRESDPKLTESLLKLNRDYRNRLPVLASEDHPWVKGHDAYIKSLPFQILGGYCFCSYAFF